jgi:sugar (pentulose or hexulose) kinase
MSQVLINQYLAELDRMKTVSGSSRESVVREAFKDLLRRPLQWEPLAGAACRAAYFACAAGRSQG